MATVINPGDRSRGQLILIGGLSLAVILVVLALVLNTAIYTENLASRNDDAIAGQAIGFQQSVDGEVRTAMARVNAKSNATASSYTDQEAFVDDTVTALGDASGQYAARDGATATVALTGGGITEGSRLYQDSADDFEDDGDLESWTVATGVPNPSGELPRVREFEMTVNRGDLVDIEDPGNDLIDTYRVRLATTGGNTWLVYVYQDLPAGEIVVEVNSPSGTLGECRVSTSSTRIDITGATVDGEACQPLELMWDDPTVGNTDLISDGTNLEMRFIESDEIEGTYSLLVGTAVPDDTTYSDDAGGPENKDVVYSTEMQVRYRTAGVDYGTTIRIAPGEYDD